MVQALSGPGQVEFGTSWIQPGQVEFGTSWIQPGQVEFGTSWIQHGATDGLQLSFEVEILA